MGNLADLKCCIAGCPEPVHSIHGGYIYCEGHLQDGYEVEHDVLWLSGDMFYRAVWDLESMCDRLPESMDDATVMKISYRFRDAIQQALVENPTGRLDRDGIFARVMADFGGVPLVDEAEQR